MRSAVNALLEWHRPLAGSPDLARKLKKMTDSPFRFFRGAYFLFCADMLHGPFRWDTPLEAAGWIAGDVHTENYGAFRSIDGGIVYDINDFDETTESRYEYDVRRLATSLLLAALENHHRLGDGVNAAEAAVRSWLHGLRHWGKLSRAEFAEMDQAHHVRQLLATAAERSRTGFLRSLAAQAGSDRFSLQHGRDYRPVSEKEREAVEQALPFFLEHCVSPKNAQPQQYRLEDVAARVAGNGSLGRLRYALLLDKGLAGKSFATLRLVEWKQSLESALDSPKPTAKKNRARTVFEAACRFQLHPKRYLGWTRLGGMPVQAREIGANDERFSHEHFSEVERFTQAAVLFGGILARVHLLGCPKGKGPRAVPEEVGIREDKWVNRVLTFACDYAGQTQRDFEELQSREDEVRQAWSR